MREATRSDTPKLNTKESQCPICWKLFTSDSACEIHKPYRKPVTGDCKDPVELGMESRERSDGVLLWSVPMDPEQKARLELMWAARRKNNV